MLFRLDHDAPTLFPDPALAEPDGLVAIGGDLSPPRLLAAYRRGIFPWFNEPPYLWWSPDPRCAITPESLHIPRRLRRVLRKGSFSFTWDNAFRDVCRLCAETPRPGQHGTWITPEMAVAYGRLHAFGFAHSIEAWQNGELVGGMYGVLIDKVFFGESMFYKVPEASKAAFAHFALSFYAWGGLLIDCQQVTGHMLRFGAAPMTRQDFLEKLRAGLTSAQESAPFVLPCS